ncbi:MAG: DNA-binding protein [Candidatus Hydrothermarchaeota archaeon]|nr:MAG: DNA-binding protein [Candidatus Hydrothermarchaeota archaeon]
MATALKDIEAAQVLRREGIYSLACFHAQQAAEKAVKALWHLSDAEPWGHSVQKLIGDLREVDQGLWERMGEFADKAAYLDKMYIPTRYPNSIPDLTPDQVYKDWEAELAVTYARSILEEVKAILGSKV